jgi:hypothetical protein
MNIKQTFKAYPLKVSGIAARMGKSRQWLNALIHERLNTNDRSGAIKSVEKEIHKLAEELKNLKIER